MTKRKVQELLQEPHPKDMPNGMLLGFADRRFSIQGNSDKGTIGIYVGGVYVEMTPAAATKARDQLDQQLRFLAMEPELRGPG